MKQYLKFTAGFLMLLLFVTTVQGQKIKNKDFKTKLKLAKKEGKELEKDDWYVSPGDLPLEKQLEKAYQKALQEDENGYPEYIIASGNAVAQTQSAAKMQAQEIAKLEIANQLSSQIAATIDNQIANNQLNQEDAATLQKMVAAAKNVISQKIGRTVKLVEMYRKLKNKNVECQVRVGYSMELARQAAISSMKEQLQADASIAADKLDKILDF
ncbi:MAG: hypothetical protein ACI9A7_000188 [Cyclobacteriaceae bacterium]|jgi:hypothetical protein